MFRIPILLHPQIVLLGGQSFRDIDIRPLIRLTEIQLLLGSIILQIKDHINRVYFHSIVEKVVFQPRRIIRKFVFKVASSLLLPDGRHL